MLITKEILHIVPMREEDTLLDFSDIVQNKQERVAAPKPGVVTCDQPGFSWQTTFGQTRASTAVSKNRARGVGGGGDPKPCGPSWPAATEREGTSAQSHYVR